MKKILFFLILSGLAWAVRSQVPFDTVNVFDPQNFVEQTVVDTANFQFIGRKNNLNRRMNPYTMKKYSTPDVFATWVNTVFDSVGNSSTYYDHFVTDSTGKTWYIDDIGRGKLLDDRQRGVIDSVYIASDTLWIDENGVLWSIPVDSLGGGGGGSQNLSISNDSLTISGGNTVVIPGTASAVSTLTFSNLTKDTVDFSGKDRKIFHVECGSVSKDTIYFVNAVNGGTYTLDLDNVAADTITWPDNLMDANEDTVGTRIYTAGKFISFYYDGTNYYTQQALGAELLPDTGGAYLLLDSFPGAWAAYSVRLIDKNYAGSAIQVTRQSDNTSQDIGFTSTVDLDTATLNTFCSGTVCYVTKWYDQSGNARHFLQADTTKAPKIYQSGAIIRENGLPSIRTDGVNDFMQGSTSTDSVGYVFSVVNPLASGVTVVGQANNAVENSFFLLQHTSDSGQNNSIRFLSIISGGTLNNAFGVDTTANRQCIATYSSNASAWAAWVNSISQSLTSSQGSNTGDWFSGNQYPMKIATLGRLTPVYSAIKIQEIIIYNTDQSATRANIEANENGYFSVY